LGTRITFEEAASADSEVVAVSAAAVSAVVEVSVEAVVEVSVVAAGAVSTEVAAEGTASVRWWHEFRPKADTRMRQ
jgi:hypothetical protein